MLHRVTFAWSVAERISRDIQGSTVIKLSTKRGKQLQQGEKSLALYGILDARKGRLLRVAIQYEVAQLLTDWNHRLLCEIYLE